MLVNSPVCGKLARTGLRLRFAIEFSVGVCIDLTSSQHGQQSRSAAVLFLLFLMYLRHYLHTLHAMPLEPLLRRMLERDLGKKSHSELVQYAFDFAEHQPDPPFADYR